MKKLFLLSVMALVVLASCEKKSGDTSYPELVDNPQVGQIYKVTPGSDVISSTGRQWYGFYRKGAEDKKVIIYFYGGGVSVNDYTAARSFFVVGDTGFYDDGTRDQYELQYLKELTTLGILSKDNANNPFKDWTFVALPYGTADFHCGTGSKQYTGIDGKQHTIYYNGYTNMKQIINKVLPLLGTPDALVVSGSSAGGFGASILSDYVIGLFPQTTNVTTVVDASMLLNDNWNSIAKNEWKSPSEIVERINSNNLSYDCLKALHQSKPYVKILYGGSPTDGDLAAYQRYFDKGEYNVPASKEDGETYRTYLKAMVDDFMHDIPDGGINIWDNGKHSDTGNTAHTILVDSTVFVDYTGNGSYAQWMIDAVNGTVKVLGLDLLEDK